MSNAVLGNYSHAKTRNKLVYAVVYLLVNVVRTSRENDYLAVLTPCLSDYLPCLCRNIAVIAVKSLVSAVNRLWYPALYVVPAESLCHDLDNVLPDVEVELGVQEVLVRETVIVCEQKLGIVGNYRTIEVIVAVALVYIVAHAGIENEVYALIEQILDMSVSKLCRIAYGIRGNGVLSEIVHIARAFVRDNGAESERGEQGVPER